VLHEIRTANVDTNTDKSNLESTEMFSEANIKMLAFLADNIFGKCLQYLLIPIRKGGATRRHSCTITSTPGSYWTENNFQKWTFCILWTFPKKLLFYLFFLKMKYFFSKTFFVSWDRDFDNDFMTWEGKYFSYLEVPNCCVITLI
jgi:hypothetical protein